ncbi:MAG: tetratricopeptide repeat protein [Planctomycetota bacterium]
MIRPHRPTFRLWTALAIGALIVLPGCNGLQGRSGRVTGTTVGSGPQIVSPVQRQHLDDARNALDDQEYELALALFRDVLAENPTVTDAYIGIGDVHMATEDFEKAEPAFRRAARLEPRNYLAQFRHGTSLQMLERFVEAIRAYLRALEVDPDSSDANLSVATCYLRLEQPGNAQSYAERAVQLEPDNGAARVNLGAVYEQVGENAKAIDEYVTALELLDNTPPVMLNLINVLAREKRYQEAVNTALTLIRIDPTANAYERLGWAYFRLGRYDKSIQAYRDATDLDPTHWPSHNGIGVNALNAFLLSNRQDMGAKEEAGRSFRKSLQINRDQDRVIQIMLNYGL